MTTLLTLFLVIQLLIYCAVYWVHSRKISNISYRMGLAEIALERRREQYHEFCGGILKSMCEFENRLQKLTEPTEGTEGCAIKRPNNWSKFKELSTRATAGTRVTDE